jgi:hypothetical protein
MSDETAVENSAQRIDWLHRNGQAVNAKTHQAESSDSWQAALSGDMELLSSPGQGVTRVTSESGEEPYLTVLAEWNESMAGACECEDFRHRGGPCKHLLYRVQVASIGSHDVIESKGLWETLVQRESDAGNERSAENLSDTTPDVEPAGEPAETSADGGESRPAPPQDEPAVPAESGETATQDFHDASAFANPLPEVDEKYAMQMNGETYIRKAGYARLLRQQGWRVSLEEVVGAHETEWTRAKYRATIHDEDGDVLAESTGTAGPPESEDMSDAGMHLDELAETRAWTRAASIATGEGMTALVEVDGGAL